MVGTFSVTEPVTMIDCWVSDVDDNWGAVPAAGSPLVGVLVATERGRSRCCACSATRRGEATRVGPPGRVPRRSNRSGPGARPAGQIITEAGDAVDAYPQSGLRHILHRLRLDSARLIRLNLGDGGTRRRRRQWPRPWPGATRDPARTARRRLLLAARSSRARGHRAEQDVSIPLRGQPMRNLTWRKKYLVGGGEACESDLRAETPREDIRAIAGESRSNVTRPSTRQRPRVARSRDVVGLPRSPIPIRFPHAQAVL